MEVLISPTETMISHLEYVVLNNFERIITLQYISDAVDIIARKNPIIKSHIVPHRVSYQLLKKVLAKLVVEKKRRINELVYIIEMVDEAMETCEDVDEIVEFVSGGLDAYC